MCFAHEVAHGQGRPSGDQGADSSEFQSRAHQFFRFAKIGVGNFRVVDCIAAFHVEGEEGVGGLSIQPDVVIDRLVLLFHTQPHIGPASIRIRAEAHVKAEGKINRVLSAKNPAPINIQRIAQRGLHHAFHLGAFIGVIPRYSGGPHHPA